MEKYLFYINLFLLAGAVLLGFNVYQSVEAGKKEAAKPLIAANVSKTLETGESSHDAVRPWKHYEGIVRRNVLNIKTSSEQEEGKINVNALEKTALNLVLWGTVTSGGKTYAVIQEKGGQQNLYAAGQQIASAVVKAVLREKVVITHNGKDQILEMETVSKPSPGGSAPVPYPQDDSGEETDNQDDVIRKKIKKSTLERRLANVDELMKEARIEQYSENGVVIGIKLVYIKAGALFRKLGLRNNDAVIGVDGVGIASMSDVKQFFGGLLNNSKTEISIIRKGKRKSLMVSLK